MSEPQRTLVKVYFEPSSRLHPNAVFEVAEVDYPDLEQFLIAIDADHLICAQRLFTTKVDHGVYEVYERRPFAFRGRAVLRAELPTGRYVEADDAG